MLIKKNEILFEKLVNLIMKKGQKAIATKICTQALFLLKEMLRTEYTNDALIHLNKKNKVLLNQNDSLALFKEAVKTVKPLLEIRKVRVSGRALQVPAIISENRSNNLALRWIILSAKKRQNVKKHININSSIKPITFSQCLALEFRDILKKPLQNILISNSSIQTKEEMHRLALANRAFYHYRWWKS
jgi:small subunit ribosomal protein S7